MAKLDKVQKSIEKWKEAPLMKLAADRDKEVRLAAIAGLGQISRDDGYNTLISSLHDADPKIRAAVAHALGQLKNEHASAHLSHLLETEQDATVKQAVQDALHQLHSSSH